ncbi:MAG: hypothetical protein H7335_02570 [Massilia sp.]|nr:hypothetical protein [Massilia sp.]
MDPDTLGALHAHLHATGSDLALVDAVAAAIRHWIAASTGRSGVANVRSGLATSAEPQAEPAAASIVASIASANAKAHPAAPCTALGYQWKELFLPDGTDLRMHCKGETHHARVSGDALVYQGRNVSARQLTIAIAGDGRNAWRELSLRLPGEKQFHPASLLRRNAQVRLKADAAAAAPAAPESPAAAIAAAAASMSEALRTALVLVELNKAPAVPKHERRLGQSRRTIDVLSDQAILD